MMVSITVKFVEGTAKCLVKMTRRIDQLSSMHRLFVERFAGDPVDAMRYSGYNGSDLQCKIEGEKLLKLPLIQLAIEERDKYTTRTTAAIADRQERQAFWTSLMRNEDPYHKDKIDPITNAPVPPEPLSLQVRLKGSELLGKSETDFIEKVDMTTTHTISDIIMQSYKLPEAEDMSIEDIERMRLEAKRAAIPTTSKPVPETPFEDYI